MPSFAKRAARSAGMVGDAFGVEWIMVNGKWIVENMERVRTTRGPFLYSEGAFWFRFLAFVRVHSYKTEISSVSFWLE